MKFASFPTADDIAFAIVRAAAAYGEDPIAIAERKESLRARSVAMVALEICFPETETRLLARCVGGANKMLSNFRTGWPSADKRIAYRNQWRIAGEIAERRRKLGLEPLHVEGLPSQSLTRRKRVATDTEPLPPEHYGDPGPGRSALDQERKR